jgi:predicted nucleic acid-binding protein
MTTSRELAALDTNVLVYALYAGAKHHRAARLLTD